MWRLLWNGPRGSVPHGRVKSQIRQTSDIIGTIPARILAATKRIKVTTKSTKDTKEKKASGGRESPGHCGWIDLLVTFYFSGGTGRLVRQ